MKPFLKILAVIFLVSILSISTSAEPPYQAEQLPDKEPGFSIESSSESFSAVDTSFSIIVEWQGTPQWMSGYDFGYEAFGGSVSRGVNSFGSNLTASNYVPVVIKLDSDTNNWSNATIFRRDAIVSRAYDAYEAGTFPGSAWDVTNSSNPRRLNIGFVEWEDGTDTIPPPNSQWDPDSTERGKYEHLFVMLSDYDSSGEAYLGSNVLYDDFDVLYHWWPRVADGHSFFETDTAALAITPVIGLKAYPFDTSITLSWINPGPDPDHFDIYYSTDSVPDLLLTEKPGFARLHSHGGLQIGEEIYYKIKSYDALDNVIYESEIVRSKTREITLSIELFGNWNQRNTYGDVCGYTDSISGTEYAILCSRYQGVGIIDISDTPLVEVGFMTGSFSNADVKDVRVYSHYAVIICEAAPTQIFDISDVTNPQLISTIPGGRHNGLVDGHHVYLVGGSFGGLEIYSILDPPNPTYVGQFAPFYYHDVAIRNDTLAACGINGDGIDILDVTDKSKPQLLSRFNYPSSGAHNAAFSEDGNFVFIGDEVGNGNYTRVFDISDLSDVQHVSDIIVHSLSIVHNCYTLGEHLFIAHYAEGLRVWNIADPTEPYEVAFYDTHPEAFTGFIGAWGVYPYYESGKVVISDMQFGLYVFNTSVPNATCCSGTIGDANGDGSEPFDLVDLSFLVDHVFRGGPGSECPYESDLNLDGIYGDILDLHYMVSMLFRGWVGPPNCP